MAKKAELIVDDRKLQVSNLDKVLYPKAGFTKSDVIDYYIRIAPVLLPHLKDRPLTMKRYPDGVEGQFFYEKNCPCIGRNGCKTAKVWSEGNKRTCIIVSRTICPRWSGRRTSPISNCTPRCRARTTSTRPTMMVFDLDPGRASGHRAMLSGWHLAARSAGGMKLKAFAKTSGSKGLQVYVPLNTRSRSTRRKICPARSPSTGARTS